MLNVAAGIASLWINRYNRDTDHRRLARGLVSTLRPAVVITGGERIFAAGADISEFGGPVEAARIGEGFHSALNAVTAIPRFVIAAVTGSSSTPVMWQKSRSPAGINAGKRPLPMPGSSTRPPRKPSRCTAVQTARTMCSGVKWAYWVQRASEA